MTCSFHTKKPKSWNICHPYYKDLGFFSVQKELTFKTSMICSNLALRQFGNCSWSFCWMSSIISSHWRDMALYNLIMWQFNTQTSATTTRTVVMTSFGVEGELQVGFCSSVCNHWLSRRLWLSQKSSVSCQPHVSDNRTQKWKHNTEFHYHQWITTGLCCTMTPTMGESSERSVTVLACPGGGSVPPLLEVNANGKPVPDQVCWLYWPYCWG